MQDIKLLKYYNIDINSLKLWLLKIPENSVVAIEIPEGLKQFTNDFIHIFKNIRKDIHFIVINEPNYGSCLLHIETLRNINNVKGLIHIGHNPYPFYMSSISLPILYLKIESNIGINNVQLNNLSSNLKSLRSKNILIFTTQQHITLANKIYDHLKSKGFNILNSKNTMVIFGCYYSECSKFKNIVDTVLTISGGIFHSLGAGLACYVNRLVDVINYDPYENKIKILNDEVKKVLMMRYYKMHKALEGKNWVLINGVEGQNRSWLVSRIKRLLEYNGLNYYEIIMKITNEESIRSIDSKVYDVFVIFSCPRIPIDDLYNYEKPVLTPGEALMVLTKSFNKYIFPW